MMKTNTKKNGTFEPLAEDERRSVLSETFNLDIVLQLSQLREVRGLTQEQLAGLSATRQQAISRMESPGYGQHSLSKLRGVAKQLRAFVDVTLVPEEQLDKYLEWRYQPVLMECAPGEDSEKRVIEWTVLVTSQTDTLEAQVDKLGASRRGATVSYCADEETATVIDHPGEAA